MPSDRNSTGARWVVVGLALWAVGLPGHAKVPSKRPVAEEHGEELWLKNCWHCHGKRALGDGPLAAAGPIEAPALAGRVPEDRDIWVTTVHRGQGTMPAFAPVLDRSAARDILVWLDALDPETGDGPSIAEKKKASSTANRDKNEKKNRVPEPDASVGPDSKPEPEAPTEEPPPDNEDDAGKGEAVEPAPVVPASAPTPSP